jgi:hypothetical protein
MKTKKQYKRRNNLTKASNRTLRFGSHNGTLRFGSHNGTLRFGSHNGTLRGGDPNPDSTPTYMKYTWLVLGLSSAYIFLKLTET